MHERHQKCGDDRAEDDAEKAEGRDPAEEGDEDEQVVDPHRGAEQPRPQHVVRHSAHRDHAPDRHRYTGGEVSGGQQPDGDRHPDQRRPDGGDHRGDARERRPDERARHARDPVAEEGRGRLVKRGHAGAEKHRLRHFPEIARQLPDLVVGQRQRADEPLRQPLSLAQEQVAGDGREDDDQDAAQRGCHHPGRNLADVRGNVRGRGDQLLAELLRILAQRSEKAL